MNEPQRPRDSFSLGGWLLAELMLGLAMLFFAANSLGFEARSNGASPTPPPDWRATITAYEATLEYVRATATAAAYAAAVAPPVATQHATWTPVPTPTLPPSTATPEPTATPDTCIETVNLVEIPLEIPAAEWIPATREERLELLRRYFAPYVGQRIGLSLTFGHSTTTGVGEQLADEANELLGEAMPAMVDDATIFKNYSDKTGEKPDGTISFGVYFLTDSCA